MIAKLSKKNVPVKSLTMKQCCPLMAHGCTAGAVCDATTAPWLFYRPLP
jgi:hypothetical protein